MLSSLLLQVASTLELGVVGKALAIGIAAIAAGIGIGKIGSTTAEGIARQPEAGSDLRMNMIISAALIEGVALFAIVVLGFIL